MRVDHEQQIHLLPIADQPLRDFHGHLPAHTESTEVIRPFRLQLAYLAQVTLGHFLGGLQVIAAAVQAPGLQSIKWIVGAKMARQFAVNEDVAAASMHAKERRFVSSRLYRDQGIPAWQPAVFANEVRKFFNRGRLK